MSAISDPGDYDELIRRVSALEEQAAKAGDGRAEVVFRKVGTFLIEATVIMDRTSAGRELSKAWRERFEAWLLAKEGQLRR